MHMRVSAAILAGGQARRMGGRNKALLEIEGARIIDRQLAALAKVCKEILIVASDLAPYRDLHGVELVSDLHPGQGPVGGLATALRSCEQSALLLIACDMPNLDPDLLLRLRDFDSTCEAVVPRPNGIAQPLCARYSKSVLPAAQFGVARGTLRMLDLLDVLDVRYLDGVREIRNINSPEDL